MIVVPINIKPLRTFISHLNERKQLHIVEEIHFAKFIILHLHLSACEIVEILVRSALDHHHQKRQTRCEPERINYFDHDCVHVIRLAPASLMSVVTIL